MGGCSRLLKTTVVAQIVKSERKVGSILGISWTGRIYKSLNCDIYCRLYSVESHKIMTHRSVKGRLSTFGLNVKDKVK